MDKISSAILKIESALDKKICKNLSEYIEVSPTKKATLLKDNQHIEDTKNRNVFNYGLNINNHHDALYQKLIFNTCKSNLVIESVNASILRETLLR